MIREPNFSRLSARDLAVMFGWYDALFFGSSISLEQDERELTSRLVQRLRRALMLEAHRSRSR